MSTRLHIVVSAELLARIDGARGDVPRSAWLRRAVEQRLAFPSVDRMVGRLEGKGFLVPAVEQALSEAKEPGTHEQADPGSVSSSEGVRSAALAEQLRAEAERYRPALEELAKSEARSYRQSVPGPNVEGVRSSAQAKRDVLPVPKRGEKK